VNLTMSSGCTTPVPVEISGVGFITQALGNGSPLMRDQVKAGRRQAVPIACGDLGYLTARVARHPRAHLVKLLCVQIFRHRPPKTFSEMLGFIGTSASSLLRGSTRRVSTTLTACLHGLTFRRISRVRRYLISVQQTAEWPSSWSVVAQNALLPSTSMVPTGSGSNSLRSCSTLGWNIYAPAYTTFPRS
jgi:hypothetical protein